MALRSNDMVLDQDEGIGKGHDVTFRLHDVPVFWLPYATFPLDDRRESGFLFPTFGLQQPARIRLHAAVLLQPRADYDATLLPRIMTDRGFMLGGEFRYLTDSSNGIFNFEVIPNDQEVKDENVIDGDTIPKTAGGTNGPT